MELELENLVLSVLKKNDCGISTTAMIDQLHNIGASSPLAVLKKLCAQGLIRVDRGKNGKPCRLKATPRAFGY